MVRPQRRAARAAIAARAGPARRAGGGGRERPVRHRRPPGRGADPLLQAAPRARPRDGRHRPRGRLGGPRPSAGPGGGDRPDGRLRHLLLLLRGQHLPLSEPR